MTFEREIEADARLRILQALAKQTDNRLSDRMVLRTLDAWGHRRSQDHVRTQMRDPKELGAVTLPVDTEAVVVAEITAKGLDHVHRRRVIEGVLKPEPGE